MRGLRSTLALLIVLIGLGGYIYFVTWKQPATSGTGQEKMFPAAVTDKINELTVKSESGDVTTLKKEDTGWSIVAPTAVMASQSEANAVASGVSQLEIVRVIDANPTNLGEYGLEKPRVEVEFKGADQQPGHLYIGEKTPTGANLYARRNDDKQVFLIAAFQESTLNRTTFDLRDKTLITIPRAKAQSVELTNAGKTVVLKKDKEWRIASPIDARADYSSSEAILGRIESAQMKSIVAENVAPADLKQYGLDKPEAQVTVNLEGSKAVLQFGRAADDTAVYARDAAKPTVVTVEKSLADDFRKSLDDYRRRDVFDFRAFNATRAEITWNGKSIVFERVHTEGDKPDTWKRVSPAEAELDKSKVETLLTGLADIRATSFKDSKAGTGLDAPAMTVYMKYDQGRSEERATFGKNGNDASASRPDDAGAMVIEAEKLNEAMTTLDELVK
jgi:Domain of unknown function (DUF4340)